MVRFQILISVIIMPRNPRLVCAGCEKVIDDSSSLRCSADLFRLFMSIRSLKKVEVGDPACRRCRYKFDNWMKKTRGDFDQFIDTIREESPLVSTILITLWSEFMYRSLRYQVDDGDKVIQNGDTTHYVEIPMKRTSASHRSVATRF